MELIENLKGKLVGSHKINQSRKLLHNLFHPTAGKTFFFVFGCQRSGTSITQQLISLCPSVYSYGEGDLYYFVQGGVDKNRLIDRKEMSRLLKKEKNEYILIKPLYESQNAESLLDAFPLSKAIWIYRDYKEVVRSHLNYYHYNAKDYIKPILGKTSGGWMGEKVSEKIAEIIGILGTEVLTAADCYSLYWIARNDLYNHVRNDGRVFLLNFEDLLSNTDRVARGIYQHFGLKYNDWYASLVNKRVKIGAGREVLIHPVIEEYCRNTLDELTNLGSTQGFSEN